MAEVELSLGRNREHIDAATYVPYLALFCAMAFGVARVIWKKYPPAEHGWVAGVIMSVFLGILFALGNTVVGEMWAWLAEGYRVGNEHMSYRAHRLWWVRHRAEMLTLSMLVFIAAAAWTGIRAARIPKGQSRVDIRF